MQYSRSELAQDEPIFVEENLGQGEVHLAVNF